MLIFLATLLATLSSILRSRAALELENLALRHQIGVLQQVPPASPQVDSTGPCVVGLAVRHLERLALGLGYRQTGNGGCLASRRLSPLLDLESAAGPTRTTGHFP